MSIARTSPGGLLTDDSGAGTDGTVLNNSERQSMLDKIDARWTELSTTSTGSQNNLSITSGGVEADVLLCNNASALTLTGIVAPTSPAKPGKALLLVSTGAGNVFLTNQSASSTAANRIICTATSGLTPLAAGKGWALLRYDDTNDRWRLVGHEQGAYITPTFAAGDFTGNNSMTWTLAAGDVSLSQYKLRGNTIHYSFVLATTTVGGTPSTALRIGNGQWGGFTAAATFYGRPAYLNDNGSVAQTGILSSVSTNIEVTKDSGANWGAGSNTTYVYGSLEFPVT